MLAALHQGDHAAAGHVGQRPADDADVDLFFLGEACKRMAVGGRSDHLKATVLADIVFKARADDGAFVGDQHARDARTQGGRDVLLLVVFVVPVCALRHGTHKFPSPGLIQPS